MWKRRMLQTVGALAFFMGSIGALNKWQQTMTTTEYMSVPAPSTARAMAGGYENLMANVLYLQFIHYFGKHMRWKQKFYNLYPVLDLATTLDPRFEGAYVMGAMALSDNGQVDAAEVLWQKAADAMPERWDIHYQAGMSLFLFAERADQYVRAAKLFHRASELPGAPPVCQYMEAHMYSKTNRREMAVKIWEDTYLHSPSKEAREVARRSLEKFKAPIPAPSASPAN